jgi:hypothetical protein
MEWEKTLLSGLEQEFEGGGFCNTRHQLHKPEIAKQPERKEITPLVVMTQPA